MRATNLITSLIFSLMIFSGAFAQTSGKEKVAESGVVQMNPVKDMVVNIGNSKEHTTLFAAVKAADMVEILQSAGPFTLFAPTNAAFDLLPPGTITALLKTENKGNLNIILKYHMVAGKLTTTDIIKLAEVGNGSTTLTTVEGKSLLITLDGNKLMIKDEKGGTSSISGKDLNQSNGVIHVIDHVLLPKDL